MIGIDIGLKRPVMICEWKGVAGNRFAPDMQNLFDTEHA